MSSGVVALCFTAAVVVVVVVWLEEEATPFIFSAFLPLALPLADPAVNLRGVEDMFKLVTGVTRALKAVGGVYPCKICLADLMYMTSFGALRRRRLASSRRRPRQTTTTCPRVQ